MLFSELSLQMPPVLVIGATGFVGRHLVAQLSQAGARVVLPVRRLDQRAMALTMLPRVEVVITDVGDDTALRSAMRGAGAVINLAGLLHSRRGQPYGPDFAAVHVELPRRIVAACAAAGVPRYLHMSALGAAADGPSMYQRSKAAGEAAASANPAVAATVFRPSVIFGPEDNFLNLFARLQRHLPLLPLGGAGARFQPVFVSDVAAAFVQALLRPASLGRVVELGGPKVYTLRQLVQLAGAWSGHPRPVLGLPPALARLQALLLEWAPGGPLMSRDNLDSMRVDNVLAPVAAGTQVLTAAALGIKLTALEAVAPRYLGARPDRLDDFRSRAGR